MYKLKLLILIIIMSGCAPKPVERSESLFKVDFTKYNMLGFLITPEKYTGDYESIGILTYTIQPSIRTAPGYHQAELKTVEIRWGRIIFEIIDLDDAIDQMYKTAHGMGADAIARFNYNSAYPVMYGGVEYPIGVRITGHAIKRVEERFNLSSEN